MENKRFLTAQNVMKMLDVSLSYAYKLIRRLNAELEAEGFASEGKGNTEWKQWAEAEKDDIALIMRRYGIDWKKKNTHNQHLSVLDYKKQERVKKVAALEEKLEGAQVVLELKEERIESLEKEIEDKHVSIRKEQSEASKDAG